MSIPQDILQTFRGNQEVMDDLLDSYTGRLENLAEFIIRWMRQNRSPSGLLQAQVSMATVAQLLREAGIGSYLEPISGLLGDAAQSMVAMSGGVEAFSALSPTALQEVFTEASLDMASLSSQTTRMVKTILEQMTVVPVPLREAAKMITSQTNILESRAKTVVNTALAQVQRRISQQALESIPPEEQLLLYVGPDDSRTRGFCDAITGKAFTPRQVGRLNNGQGMSVIHNGGGWNCRHTWAPISRGFAEQRGVEIGANRDVSRANGRAS